MSRAKIGVVVAVVVAALTAAAYFLTTKRMEKRIREDVEARVGRAQKLVIHSAVLDAKSLDERVARLGRDPRFAQALAPASADDPNALTPAQRTALARGAFNDFVKAEPIKPDFVAMTDKDGWVVIMDPPLPDRENWKDGAEFKDVSAVREAFERREVTREIWDYRNAVTKVGVTPIVGPADQPVLGAVVVAYALNASEARRESDLLGMDFSYFLNDRVRATSYGRKGAEGDVAALTEALKKHGLNNVSMQQRSTPVVHLMIQGKEFVAAASLLPYGKQTSGAMVMVSLDEALRPIGEVRWTILLLGLGAILVAILAMLITARLILNPAEEIENGVTEIINGNIDYTFKPVGADFDGLANALNVMLARLLGRPEPGEEPLDDDGRPTGGVGQVLLDEPEAQPQQVAQGGSGPLPDAQTVALAQEPEADYYKRIYGEYLAARKAAGEKVEGVSFEGFVAKLRLNEGNLKKKYNCRAVRFRVTTKDGQVTLKPVPIQ